MGGSNGGRDGPRSRKKGFKRWSGSRKVASALVLCAAVPVLVGAGPASTKDPYVGVCVAETLTTTAIPSPTPLLPVANLLAPTDVLVSASMACLVNGTTQTVTINGTVHTPAPLGAWSCAGGAAVGELTYSTTGMGPVTATTTLVAVGPELSLAAATDSPTNEPVFEAAGQFVLSTDSALDCTTGTAVSLDWDGVFEFVYLGRVVPGTSR